MFIYGAILNNCAVFSCVVSNPSALEEINNVAAQTPSGRLPKQSNYFSIV